MKLESKAGKLLPNSISGIVVTIVGCSVLLFGLVQARTYFLGINPPKDSQAVSVPASSGLGIVQITLAVLTLLVIVGLIKNTRRWSGATALVILFVIFFIEALMAIGYSGI